jgi:hypothetical protein
VCRGATSGRVLEMLRTLGGPLVGPPPLTHLGSEVCVAAVGDDPRPIGQSVPEMGSTPRAGPFLGSFSHAGA